MMHGLVGLVMVVTGGADVVTPCSVTTLCLLGSSPSMATLYGGCRSISIIASDLMMAFCRRCRLFFGKAMMNSLKYSCTVSTCCVGLSGVAKQYYEKRSKDPDTL